MVNGDWAWRPGTGHGGHQDHQAFLAACMTPKGTTQSRKTGISEVALETNDVKTGGTCLMCVYSEMPQALNHQEQGKLQKTE